MASVRWGERVLLDMLSLVLARDSSWYLSPTNWDCPCGSFKLLWQIKWPIDTCVRACVCVCVRVCVFDCLFVCLSVGLLVGLLKKAKNHLKCEQKF